MYPPNTNTHIHRCTHVHTQTNTHMHTHTCICTHKHTHTQTLMHAQIHVHIHTERRHGSRQVSCPEVNPRWNWSLSYCLADLLTGGWASCFRCLFTQEKQRGEKWVSLKPQGKEHIQIRIFLSTWLWSCRAAEEGASKGGTGSVGNCDSGSVPLGPSATLIRRKGGVCLFYTERAASTRGWG